MLKLVASNRTLETEVKTLKTQSASQTAEIASLQVKLDDAIKGESTSKAVGDFNSSSFQTAANISFQNFKDELVEGMSDVLGQLVTKNNFDTMGLITVNHFEDMLRKLGDLFADMVLDKLNSFKGELIQAVGGQDAGQLRSVLDSMQANLQNDSEQFKNELRANGL